MKKDIYIIKNSINDKVYIGQAKNAAERWLSHIYNSTYEAKTNKNKQILHKAIAEYGIDKFHYEILEYQIENYDEREQYWIKKYNSIAPNGYNIAVGGSGTGRGTESVNAVFKDNETLMRCISEISSTTKTLANIAIKYGCSSEVILAINKGLRYKQENLCYPLRDTEVKYTNDKVKQIRYSLKYEQDLTMKEISQKYKIDLSQLSLINNGKKYYLHSESYPLRGKRKTDLDDTTLKSIMEDIIYSELCLSDIAAKYNISRSRVSGINQGNIYKQQGVSYPLRKENDARTKSLKKFLDIDIIREIQDKLRGNLSVTQIAKMFGVSQTTIHNINNGDCKKYRIDDVVYPIRKFN